MKSVVHALFGGSMLLAMGAAANAADLTLPVVADRAQELADWTGAYVGASIGLGGGISTRDVNGLDFTYSEDDLSGWVAGVQAGYNIQTGNLLLGLEGNIDWTSLTTPGAPDALPRDINWLASIRGRAGFALDSVAIYGMAGLVVAETDVDSFLEDGPTSVEAGWTAGVGMAAMVSESVSVSLDYAHSEFDSVRYDFTAPAPFWVNSAFSTDTVKLGVNYHF